MTSSSPLPVVHCPPDQLCWVQSKEEWELEQEQAEYAALLGVIRRRQEEHRCQVTVRMAPSQPTRRPVAIDHSPCLPMAAGQSECEMEYRSLALWVQQLLRWQWETPNWFIRQAIWEREMALQAWELEQCEAAMSIEDERLAAVWLAIDRRSN